MRIISLFDYTFVYDIYIIFYTTGILPHAFKKSWTYLYSILFDFDF